MKTNKTNNNATINNSNSIKEESIMTTTMETIINAMANVTNNEEKLQVIYLLLNYVNNITNKHDVAYINKEELVDFANYLGMNTNRKTTRTNAYDFIKNYAEENNIECYISLEEKMACGIGACLACTCKSKEKDHHTNVHNKRICKDGPVFLSTEVEI